MCLAQEKGISPDLLSLSFSETASGQFLSPRWNYDQSIKYQKSISVSGKKKLSISCSLSTTI